MLLPEDFASRFQADVFLSETSFHLKNLVLKQLIYSVSMRGWLNRELLPVFNKQHTPWRSAPCPPSLGWTQASEKCSPASEVAADAARRDNTGVGGIATPSTAAGFFLVIMVDAELSFLLCVAVWSTFKWGLAIPKKKRIPKPAVTLKGQEDRQHKSWKWSEEIVKWSDLLLVQE